MELAPVSRRYRAGRKRALEGLEIGTPGPRFLGRKDVDGREVAIAMERVDLRLAQLGHRHQPPVPVALASGPHFADSPDRNSVSASGPTLRGIW